MSANGISHALYFVLIRHDLLIFYKIATGASGKGRVERCQSPIITYDLARVTRLFGGVILQT